MLLTQLLDKCQEALRRGGDMPVKIEILDHGASEIVNPTTTFMEHEDISATKVGRPTAFFITAMIDD